MILSFCVFKCLINTQTNYLIELLLFIYAFYYEPMDANSHICKYSYYSC